MLAALPVPLAAREVATPTPDASASPRPRPESPAASASPRRPRRHPPSLVRRGAAYHLLASCKLLPPLRSASPPLQASCPVARLRGVARRPQPSPAPRPRATCRPPTQGARLSRPGRPARSPASCYFSILYTLVFAAHLTVTV